LGGLFLPAPFLNALASLALAGAGAACAPAGPPARAVPAELAQAAEPVPNPLAVYRTLGYITGEPRFPAVGSFAYLPGPGDSTYTILTLSLPNSALRFRRDPPGFAARYRVEVTVGDSTAPVARLAETQEVRVRTFRETSRRDESIVFQGFLKLLPGEYPAEVSVQDLASGAGLAAETRLRVPRFGVHFITAPLIVYEAEPRASRDAPPALILNPRATIPMEGGRSRVYVESGPGDEGVAILEIASEGRVIEADTLAFRPARGGLGTSIVPLLGERLAPGTFVLRARPAGAEAADSTALLVSLMPDWVVEDYGDALSYLRYAGTPAQLDSLRDAPLGERARLLHAFWKSRDPVPETAENEFFERYFRRIRDANNRFSEAATAGWLTDRGAVYVTFGPPDEVLRHLDTGQEPERSQVWLYNESLGFELRLVFTDPTATGAFRLTIESRRAFLEAVQTLYS
jgi:GWxTD domain-containing protein